jgi:hypothetical protein
VSVTLTGLISLVKATSMAADLIDGKTLGGSFDH